MASTAMARALCRRHHKDLDADLLAAAPGEVDQVGGDGVTVRLFEQASPSVVYITSLGGFDTHAGSTFLKGLTVTFS